MTTECRITAVILLLAPATALACPQCYAASNGRVLVTYYLSAAFLSLLPFAVVGTVAAVALRMKRRLGSATGDADALEDLLSKRSR